MSTGYEIEDGNKMNSMIPNFVPEKPSRIVVAMSGGVDSSVTAGWLKEQGHEVIGISLQLHDMAEKVENEFGTCCSLSDIMDARRVAEKLEIPFYVNNMEEEFREAVVDDFIQEYLNGRTPNPCIRCNEKVKFRQLMDWALDLGADYLATGHYATVRLNQDNQQVELYKGGDNDKDQSYFLFAMKQKDLAKTLFPIGGFEKKVVRDLAIKYGLLVANKPDSQEICFVQAKSYKDFIEEEVPKALLKPGNIVDPDGNVLGQHTGLHQFTIGQRKGLGVHGKEPLFVLALRGKSNEVVVGPEQNLFRKSALVSNVSWINAPVNSPKKVLAKIRYRSKESPVEVSPTAEGKLEVKFEIPQRAITPGQAMVFYEGEKVIGGGWIEDLSIQ
jgi:tRNA-specific 2-thiouridylase